MIFSKFIELYDHCHNLVLEYLPNPRKLPCGHLQSIPAPTPSSRQLLISCLYRVALCGTHVNGILHCI